MRSVFALSTAVALFASSAFASNNADFNPVNFADEVAAPAALTDAFVTFRWKGEEAVAMESFDLNVEDSARIQVTDFKNRGDMFEVFDNGKSLGTTTKVDNLKDEEVFAATPEEALKDDRFSKGIFDLAKGEHKITIKAMGPYEAGTAAIRVLDHANVAFYKKDKHDKHGGDDDDDEDDEDKHGKHGKDDDDDEHDDKHGHDDEDDEGCDEDDEEEDKGHWHKDDHEDHEGGGDWHKGGDKEHHEGGGNWHKGGDKEHHEGGGDWHKGGDDHEGGGDWHKEDHHEGGGDWHKGGDDHEDGGDWHKEDHHEGGGDWHKGGDDHEGGGDWHKEDHHEGGGDWHKEDHHGGKHGYNKWGDRPPTNEEYDLSHTLTYTKTKWVVQKPTHLPPIEPFEPAF